MSRTRRDAARARAAKANRGAYRKDAAAVDGLLKLEQGAVELSRANLGPVDLVDHWGDAGGTAVPHGGVGVCWGAFVVLAFARACRLHVGLARLQRSSGEVCGAQCV